MKKSLLKAIAKTYFKEPSSQDKKMNDGEQLLADLTRELKLLVGVVPEDQTDTSEEFLDLKTQIKKITDEEASQDRELSIQEVNSLLSTVYQAEKDKNGLYNWRQPFQAVWCAFTMALFPRQMKTFQSKKALYRIDKEEDAVQRMSDWFRMLYAKLYAKKQTLTQKNIEIIEEFHVGGELFNLIFIEQVFNTVCSSKLPINRQIEIIKLLWENKILGNPFLSPAEENLLCLTALSMSYYQSASIIECLNATFPMADSRKKGNDILNVCAEKFHIVIWQILKKNLETPNIAFTLIPIIQFCKKLLLKNFVMVKQPTNFLREEIETFADILRFDNPKLADWFATLSDKKTEYFHEIAARIKQYDEVTDLFQQKNVLLAFSGGYQKIQSFVIDDAERWKAFYKEISVELLRSDQDAEALTSAIFDLIENYSKKKLTLNFDMSYFNDRQDRSEPPMDDAKKEQKSPR